MNKIAFLCTVPTAAIVGHYVAGYSWLVVLLGSAIGTFVVLRVRQ